MSVARPDTWMPMYWGDFWRDTAHLNRADAGSYLHLIGHYWTAGKPLPDDNAILARLAHCTRKEWVSGRKRLEAFFIIEDGQWRHKRIEEELRKAQERYGKRFEARANFQRKSVGKSPSQIDAKLATQPQPQSTIVDRAGAPDERIASRFLKRRPTDDERALAAKATGTVPWECTDADVDHWQRILAKRAGLTAPVKPADPAELGNFPTISESSPAADGMPDLPAALDRRTP